MKHNGCEISFSWRMLISWAALFLAVFGIELSLAFPNGAGFCPAGIAAVGGVHLDPTKVIVNGPLLLGNYSLDIDRGAALTPSSDKDNPSIVLETGVDYLLRLSAALKRYKGFLIRLQAPDTVDTSTALIPSSLAKIADVCIEPVVGVSHFDRELKNHQGGTLRIDEPSIVILDVTVVRENTDRQSSYFYSRYTLRFEKGCTPSQKGAEECLLTELTEEDALLCSDCITDAFATQSESFENCDDLEVFTCGVLSICATCGSCTDELQSLYHCEFARDLGCNLDCGLNPAPVAPTEPPEAPTVMPVAPTVIPVPPSEAPVAPSEASEAPTESPVAPGETCLETQSLYEECAAENWNNDQKVTCETCVALSFPPSGSECEAYQTNLCDGLASCECGGCSSYFEDYLECSLNAEPGLDSCSLDCGVVAPTTPVPSDLAPPTPVPSDLPIEVPSTLPTTVAPMAAPVAAPVAAPAAAPVAAPAAAPVAAPAAAPSAASPTAAAPVSAPVAAPVSAPVAAPVAAPSAATPTAGAPSAATPTAAAPVTAPSVATPTAAAPVASVPTLGPVLESCNSTVETVEMCLTTDLTQDDGLLCTQCLFESFSDLRVQSCSELEAYSCGTLNNTCAVCGSCSNEIASSLNCTFLSQYGCTIDCFPPPTFNCTGKLDSLSVCISSAGEAANDCLTCLVSALGDLPSECEQVGELGCQVVSGCPCESCETEVQDWIGCALGDSTGCSVVCPNQTSSG